MITIITGVPGMGKTALLVQMLLKNDKAANPRPVFVMGVPDLKIEHIKAPPVEDWTEKRADPDDPSLLLDYYTLPPNSYLVVDEAQRVFRPRSSGSKVPPHVAALETHRHTGLDIILLTQKPSLLDINVRQLCGRHIHIRDSILGRRLYEWPEYNDTDNKSNLEAATKRAFKPPKESFKHYKSSELHTKQPRRFHQVWLYLALSFVFLGFFAYRTYNNFFGDSKMRGVHSETSKDRRLVDKGKAGDSEGQGMAQVVQHGSALVRKRPGHSQEAIEEPVGDPAFNISNQIHPYSGFTFILVGRVQTPKIDRTYYKLINGQYGFTATSDQLEKLGYAITVANDCTSYLMYEKAKIVAICALPEEPQRPEPVSVASKEPEGIIKGRQPLDAEPIGLDARSWETYREPSPYSKY